MSNQGLPVIRAFGKGVTAGSMVSLMPIWLLGMVLGLSVHAEDSDQLQLALIQTEASIKSLDQGDAPAAAAHAEAARSHIDIARREAQGSLKNTLNTCQSRLKETERQSREGHPKAARTAAEQAVAKLQALVPR